MSSKASDRIKALQQQRAAALAPQTPAPPSPAANEDETQAISAVQSHFGGPLAAAVGSRPIQRIPVAQIAPDERPEMRQPRLLPHPFELLLDGEPVPEYALLVAELQDLGRSLRQRQIQPIVVYKGRSKTYPGARFLLLVGQRRWTAAQLVGLDALDAIEVEPPTPDERIRIQYAENEDRADFSDMERAWSLQQLKRSLGDPPWEVVEQELKLSTSRRHQLIRLLALTPEQQREVARLRLQETQARPLHTAVRNSELAPEQVDTILRRLASIAEQRLAVIESEAAADPESARPKTSGIDGPTVARLVARARRDAEAYVPLPRWVPAFREQLTLMIRAASRNERRVDQLSFSDASELLHDVNATIEMLQRLAHRLKEQDKEGSYLHEEPREANSQDIKHESAETMPPGRQEDA